MNKEKFRLLKNIRFETELLESLGWDESQLKALFLYLETALEDNYNYTEISAHIKDFFGNDTFIIISKVFKEEAFLLPLHRKNKNEN
jgi:hypothetical protein